MQEMKSDSLKTGWIKIGPSASLFAIVYFAVAAAAVGAFEVAAIAVDEYHDFVHAEDYAVKIEAIRNEGPENIWMTS